MAHIGAILVLGVFGILAALSVYLYVGPLFWGRYRKPPDRRREHRHAYRRES